MKIDARKVFIVSILAVCIIAINLVVYNKITKGPIEEPKEQIIDTALLAENFNNIFDNQIDYQNNNIDITKEDHLKELVYTSYTNQENLDNTYQLNVNIPYININSEGAKTINTEINNLFYDKVADVISNKNRNIIYMVNYKAYINDNILSLVIKSTLKEGENAQRVIIKTYNYNMSSNRELGINEILQYREISTGYAQSRINEIIEEENQTANQYQQLGYDVYLRDINDSIYKIENTKVYFIGKDKALYIIYPYGNSKYTSEVDLLVI